MGSNYSKFKLNKNINKEIIVINKSKLYLFISNLNLISIIKPNNICLMNIQRVNFNSILLNYKRMKYSYDFIEFKLSFEDKKYIYQQLLKGLNQLHQISICHGNIKKTNILLTKTYDVFLSDYCINTIRYYDYNYKEENDIIELNKIFSDIFKNDYDINYSENLNYPFIVYNNVKYFNQYRILYNLIDSYNSKSNNSEYFFTILNYIWLIDSNYLTKIITKSLKFSNKITNTYNRDVDIDEILLNKTINYEIYIACIKYIFR